MNILVLQPYINRTVDSINDTGMRAYRAYCEITGRGYIADKTVGISTEALKDDTVVTVPDEVLRLFDFDWIDPEDKILGDDMFILSEYIKEIERADLIILVRDDCYWEYEEMDLFSHATSLYPRLEKKCFKLPCFNLMLPNYKEYTKERENCREHPVPENVPIGWSDERAVKDTSSDSES